MLTLETEHSHRTLEAPAARGATPRTIHTLHIGIRVLTVLAAVLAFGLLGVLVGTWHQVRGRRRADLTCRGCLRRRDLVLAGTFVLAGLVVLGSGATVHHEVSGSELPACSTELPDVATTDNLHQPLVAGAGVSWLEVRRVLTAPASGLARRYASDRGGGLCDAGALTLVFLPSAGSDSGLAVGSVVLTGASPAAAAGSWDAMARHESRHVTQWAALTLAGGPVAMPLLYTVTEAFLPGPRNPFERAAGLDDGGYPEPDSFGPRPDWAMVTVLGLVVLAASLRRLRWASRVLTGRAGAAVASQDGLCPLHSRGWFRLRPQP